MSITTQILISLTDNEIVNGMLEDEDFAVNVLCRIAERIEPEELIAYFEGLSGDDLTKLKEFGTALALTAEVAR